MGITHDQITKSAVQRVRDYASRVVELVDASAPGIHPRREARQDLDAYALAFAHAVTRSDHVRFALGSLCRAMREGEFLEDDCMEIRLLESIVRGVAALAVVDGDQWSEINGAVEALRQIEGWALGAAYEEAILYVDDSAWRSWGGDGMDEHMWLGVRKRLDRYVPEAAVLRALDSMREK